MSYNSKYTGEQVESLLDKIPEIESKSESNINILPFTIFALKNITISSLSEDDILNGSSATSGYPIMCKRAYIDNDGNKVYEKFSSIQEAFEVLYPYVQYGQFESFYITVHEQEFNDAGVLACPIIAGSDSAILMLVRSLPSFPTETEFSIGIMPTSVFAYAYSSNEIITTTSGKWNNYYNKSQVEDLISISSSGSIQPIIPMVVNFISAPSDGDISEDVLIDGSMPILCKSFTWDETNQKTVIEKFSSLSEIYELLSPYATMSGMLKGSLVKVHNTNNVGVSTYVTPLISEDSGITLILSSTSIDYSSTILFAITIKSDGTLKSASVSYKELAFSSDIKETLNTEV